MPQAKSLVVPGVPVQVRDPGPQKTLAVRQPAPQVGHVPELVAAVGPKAARRFTTFFTDDIENHNTRAAYLRAAFAFLDWCAGIGLSLEGIQSVHVAAYREHRKRHRYQKKGRKKKRYAKATIKQHLAAIRKLYDWLVIGHVIPFNPAAAVRGPKHVVTEGLTPHPR